MPRPITYPNIFGTLSGTVSASLLDQNWAVDASIFNDSAAGWVNYASDTGSPNNIVVTLSPPPSGYINGFFLSFSPLNQNTGPSSINVNGLGNISLVQKDGSALATQMLLPGFTYTAICINGSMRIISPSFKTVGEVMMFAGSGNLIPPGFFPCFGETVSRATYSALFNVIGTAYGNGDGSGGTFSIPNFVNKFPMYTGTPGNSGGAASVQLSIAQLPVHNHPVNDSGHSHPISDPGHFHTYANFNVGSPGTSLQQGTSFQAGSSNTSFNTTGINTTLVAPAYVSVGYTGSGSAFSVQNPWLDVFFIIRAYAVY